MNIAQSKRRYQQYGESILTNSLQLFNNSLTTYCSGGPKLPKEKNSTNQIVILIPMFLFCLGLDNCKSPEEPEGYFKYRYEVEVIYSGVAEGGRDVTLYYILYDPTASGSGIVPGYIKMNELLFFKSFENRIFKFRIHLSPMRFSLL